MLNKARQKKIAQKNAQFWGPQTWGRGSRGGRRPGPPWIRAWNPTSNSFYYLLSIVVLDKSIYLNQNISSKYFWKVTFLIRSSNPIINTGS